MTETKLGAQGGWSNNYAASITASRQLSPGDSGKVFYLNLAAGLTVTLPASDDIEAGWNVEMVVGTAPTGGDYVITEDTSNDTDILVSGFTEREVDTGDDGPYSSGHTTISLKQSVAVKGDSMRIRFDGTYFYTEGVTKADGGAVLA